MCGRGVGGRDRGWLEWGLLGTILLALLVRRRVVRILLLSRDPWHYEIGRHEGIVIGPCLSRVVIRRDTCVAISKTVGVSTRAETMSIPLHTSTRDLGRKMRHRFHSETCPYREPWWKPSSARDSCRMTGVARNG